MLSTAGLDLPAAVGGGAAGRVHFLTSVASNVLSNSLRDALDVKAIDVTAPCSA